MNIKIIFFALCTLFLTFPALATPSKDRNKAAIERGRYIVKIAACNDCHTTGYAEANGNLPESQWLEGDSVGGQLIKKPQRT